MYRGEVSWLCLHGCLRHYKCMRGSLQFLEQLVRLGPGNQPRRRYDQSIWLFAQTYQLEFFN